MRRLLLPMLALACCATPVHAGDAVAGNEAPAVVTVSSVRDPELKSYRTLLKSYDVVDKFRALAPVADFRFVLRPPPGAPAKDLSLRIADGANSVHVPVAEDNTFELPRLAAFENADAELLLNVKKGQARWRPLVRTPGLAPDTRRLGDLRLECEIRWAVEYDEFPFVERNVFRALGGPCHSGRVRVHFGVSRPLASATMVDGERRHELRLDDGGYSFIPLLHDATFDNEALVQLVYKDAAQSSSQIK
jgi:hypothetical protein